MKVRVPTKGSFMILKASAANGALSSEGRSMAFSMSFASTPVIGGRSNGEGM